MTNDIAGVCNPRFRTLVVIRRLTLFSRISRKIEGRSQTPNFRQGMDLRMSHGQNQVQNAFGQSHESFEDFLFNSEIVKIVDAQICDRNDFLFGRIRIKVGGRKSLT